MFCVGVLRVCFKYCYAILYNIPQSTTTPHNIINLGSLSISSHIKESFPTKSGMYADNSETEALLGRRAAVEDVLVEVQ